MTQHDNHALPELTQINTSACQADARRVDAPDTQINENGKQFNINGHAKDCDSCSALEDAMLPLRTTEHAAHPD